MTRNVHLLNKIKIDYIVSMALVVILPVVFGISIVQYQNMLIAVYLIPFFIIMTVLLFRAPEYSVYIAYMLIPFFFIPLIFDQLWLGRVLLLYSLMFIFGQLNFGDKNTRLQIGSINKFFILATLWIIIVSLTSKNLTGARRILLSYLTNTITFSLLMYWVLTDINKVKTWLKVVLFVGCISALLAVLQILFGKAFLISELIPIIGRIKNIELYEEAYKIGHQMSAAGLFSYRAKNVVFLILPWCLTAYYISTINALTVRKWLSYIFLFTLIGAAFLSSGARSGLVLPILCLIFLIVYLPDKTIKKNLLILLMLTCLCAIVALASTSFNLIEERFSNNYVGSDTGMMQLGMKERLYIFTPALKIIFKHPLFGIGIANKSLSLYGRVSEAHNIFLDIGLRLGAFAMILGIGFVAYIFKKYLYLMKKTKKLKDSTLNHITTILFITFIVITVEGIVGFGFLSLLEGFPPYVAVMIMPDILERIYRQQADNQKNKYRPLNESS